MRGYDRIFQLRHFENQSLTNKEHFYELVEIPKSLLEQAKSGIITMSHKSKQTPKPGYCKVGDKFELYFDGGTERKLQVGINKKYCEVHATWTIPDVVTTEAAS